MAIPSVGVLCYILTRRSRDRKYVKRCIHNMVFLRIPGHLFFLILYMYHTTTLQNLLEELLPTHPELVELKSMSNRFLTNWNLQLQIFYSILSMVCDVPIALNKGYFIPELVRHIRYTMFVGLIWPVAWVVFIFWPFNVFRRELVTVPGLPLIMSPTCTFVWHGAVQIYALWELFLLPKKYYMKTAWTFHIMVVFFTVFNIVMLYTRYISHGIWPLPILNMVDGTILPFVTTAVIELVGIIAYFYQIPLRNFVWMRLGLLI